MDIIGGSLSAAAVIAVIMLMRLAMFRRLPKRVLSALWLIAAAKLLLPFGGVTAAEASASDTAVTEVASFAEAAAGTVRTAVPSGVLNVAVSVPFSENGLFICECIWLCGVVFVSAFFVFTHIKTRRTFSCALPADYDISQLKKDFGIIRRVRLLVSDRTDTPLTYGIFASVIILPKSMELTDEGMRNVLCHELAHIKRFDALFKTVIAVCAAVHWFNPMAWVMFVLADRDIELACDETALRRGKAVPEAYAMSLISVEESRCIPRFPLAGSFAGGKLEERVRGVMTKRKSALAGLFASAVSAAAAFALNVIVMPYEDIAYGISVSDASASDAYEYSETAALYSTAVSADYDVEYAPIACYEVSDADIACTAAEWSTAYYSISLTEDVPAAEADEAIIFSGTADEPPQGSYIIVYDYPTFAYAYTTTERGGINTDTVVVVKIAEDGSEISQKTSITPMSR